MPYTIKGGFSTKNPKEAIRKIEEATGKPFPHFKAGQKPEMGSPKSQETEPEKKPEEKEESKDNTQK